MSLSKFSVDPLRRGLLLPFHRIAVLPTGRQNGVHNNLVRVQPRFIAQLNNVNFTQKSVLLLICKRHFNLKNNPNSFINRRDRWGAEAYEKFLIFVTAFIFSWYLIDYPYIWENKVPKAITQPIQNSFRSVGDFYRGIAEKLGHFKMPKRADSLAKVIKRADSLAKADLHSEDKSAVVDQSVLSNVMQYFNIKREQQSKAGGFRDRKIVEYENRIRLYSNPDKIFRYFASIKIVYSNGDSEIYMTPDDFLRALTPGVKQPDGLGLDQFKRIDLSKNATEEAKTDLSSLLNQVLLAGNNDFKHDLKPDSIFYRLSKFGLINFSDYLFLLTVISVSQRHFEIAFRFFDQNGDGDLEFEEFEKISQIVLAQTSIGQKMGKAVHYKGISSAISHYFFGQDLKNRLTIDLFIDFQKSLQSELLTLEFERKHPNSGGCITETDFGELLVAYAILSEKKRNRMVKRVMKKFGGPDTPGITLEDYKNFFRFLQNINDVDIALTVYNIAGASIDQATLKHVAKTCANVELSDHLVDVVFTLFDDNEDGQLSNKEFISVMKERLRRGLQKPRNTGFLKIMYTIWKSLISLDF